MSPVEGERIATAQRARAGRIRQSARSAAHSGRIVPGARADVTGFSEDPTAVSGDALIDLPITLTVVDGRVVH